MTKARWQIGFAVALLVGYTILTVVMIRTIHTTDDLGWTRLVYIFGSAEALAFTAVGWMFGAEVHRARADAAEKRADDESGKAAVARDGLVTSQIAAAESLIRGQALAAAVRTLTPQSASTDEEPLLGGEDSVSLVAVGIQLRALADELFPAGL